MKKISRKRYIQGFLIVVLFLAIAREVCPSLAYDMEEKARQDSLTAMADTVIALDKEIVQEAPKLALVEDDKSDGFVPHRIYSVASYAKSFPDANDIQLVAAQKYGISPVADRKEAEKRKDELVYIGSNPYFFVEPARSSIPYLVPRASELLQDIGSVFFDSLQIKGVPLHKVIVTSVLRTKEDIKKLQRGNVNATTNSCHQYATTFDICYNRYKTVEAPEGPTRRTVTNDTLKWVLSEVLDDMRQQGRCYVKYERKQGCYHITVR